MGSVTREAAIARAKTAPMRALVVASEVHELCIDAYVIYSYFRPTGASPQPFEAALTVGDGPWGQFSFPRGQLFVAGIAPVAKWTPTERSCSGPMPSVDAAVVALVPVKDAGEGARLIASLGGR